MVHLQNQVLIERWSLKTTLVFKGIEIGKVLLTLEEEGRMW